MGDIADDLIDQSIHQMSSLDFDWEDQDNYDSKVEYWSNQPIDEVVKMVQPYVDREGVHECITGAIEDYIIFGTIGEFQKLALARFIARI